MEKTIFWRKFTDLLLSKTFLRFVPKSITPNQVTWVRIASWPIVFYLLLSELYTLGLIVFSISVFTDALDGAMARTRDQVTEFGKVLDPVADKGLIGIAALVFVPRLFGWPLLIAIITLEILNSLVAVWTRKKVGYNSGSNGAGALKMIVQSVAFILIFIGLLISSFSLIYYAEALLYISLFLVLLSTIFFFVHPFLHKNEISQR